MKSRRKDNQIEIEEEEGMVLVQPISNQDVENTYGESDNPILQLQLTMATNSINHEYARIEFEDTIDTERKEELLDYMSGCRQKYFEARESLNRYDSGALQEFESDLLQQKVRTLNRFHA